LIDATGPIPIALYMAECNAHYYAMRDPLGAAGDFTTAPEISQMFGEMVGLWCADIWLRAGKPSNLAYVELGPGRGTLASDALRTAAQFGFEPPAFLIDSSPILQAKQQERLPNAQILDALEHLFHAGPIVVIANEFFDALPVRQLVATHSGWRERVVARNQGQFMAMPGVIPMDLAVPSHLQNQPPGSILEISPTRDAVMQDICSRIAEHGGAILSIDYGYSGPKTGDTFQAVSAHSFANPFANPGENDLTAHVDFAALAQAARNAGVRAYGPAAQGDWLKALGIEARAQALAAQTPKLSDTIYAALARLTEPAHMGRLFQILGAAHPGWPRPEGF
jgi:SAM-dependent MidA family methyltransferase